VPVINPKFWKDRRVLVTGHSGFKGSWLCLLLQRLGASIAGYSDLLRITDPCLFEAASVESGIQNYIGDVRDARGMLDVIQYTQPEIIIHLAAQPLVSEGCKDPVGTFQTNVMGTVNLLEAARQVDSVRVVLVVTTDKVYKNDGRLRAYNEDDPLGGVDPYAASKSCAEHVVVAYGCGELWAARGSFARLATARAGNVIGGGDWALGRLVPDLVRARRTGTVLGLRYPQAVRPWQHVLDPLAGYLKLCENLWFDYSCEYERPWNFGPSDEGSCSVGELVRRFNLAWGDIGLTMGSDEHLVHEDLILRLDSTNAQMLLNHTPQWNLEKSIKRTVEWYQAYYAGLQPMRDFTLSQIDQFLGNFL